MLLALAMVLALGLAVLVESVLPGYASNLSGSLAQTGLGAALGGSNAAGTPTAAGKHTVPPATGTLPATGTPGTPSAGQGTTPVATGDATSIPGSGDSTTATPGAEPTATEAPAAPHLNVSPLTASGNCLLGSWPELTVRNDGGGRLSWSATTSDKAFVKASPSSSTLDAGASVTVSLSGALHLGNQLKVTFSSNGGVATATITCR